MWCSGFACARHKDILVKGKLLITDNWICFYSSIMGWETKVGKGCGRVKVRRDMWRRSRSGGQVGH